MPLTEVADRVWLAPQEWCDVNVVVIGGADGLVVVDSTGSTPTGRRVADDVRHLGGAVLAVVDTHWHFDHSFGHAAFRETWPAADLLAHEAAADELARRGEDLRSRAAADPDEPHAADLAATTLVVPERTFSAVTVLDLGDRVVEVVHPGRGHTAGDAVLRVGDADLLVAGDLVEQSDRDGGVPGYGDDCFPLEWPATLDVVLDLLTPASTVLPGHGRPVDRGFVEDQRDAVGRVAQGVRDLAGAGVRAEDALAAGTWPFPADRLVDAVRRGYAHLPRDAHRLPLV